MYSLIPPLFLLRFVRLALQHGCPLVPMFTFGQRAVLVPWFCSNRCTTSASADTVMSVSCLSRVLCPSCLVSVVSCVPRVLSLSCPQVSILLCSTLDVHLLLFLLIYSYITSLISFTSLITFTSLIYFTSLIFFSFLLILSSSPLFCFLLFLPSPFSIYYFSILPPYFPPVFHSVILDFYSSFFFFLYFRLFPSIFAVG